MPSLLLTKPMEQRSTLHMAVVQCQDSTPRIWSGLDQMPSLTTLSTFGLGYAVGKFDCICGLGLSGISVDGVSSGTLSANIFAFSLGTGGGGELVIGGVDPAHYTGDFSYLPVQNMSRWTHGPLVALLLDIPTRL